MSNYAKKTGRPFPFTDEQVEEILALWDSGASVGEIARKMGSWSSTIKSVIERTGRVYEVRNIREKHYAWRGGRHIDNQGYVIVSVPPEWPWRDEMARGRKHKVMEHRKVMADAIGRALRDDETVHHKDGNRQNNSLENLQLRTGPHGVGIIMVCNHCGSHDVSPAPLPE